MASNIIACRNVGCRATFKSYEERKRHHAKCKQPRKPQYPEFDQLEGGKYLCKKCLSVISQQGNLGRHKKSCKGSMKSLHICDVCAKQFDYQSKLLRHKRQAHKETDGNVGDDDDDVFNEVSFDDDFNQALDEEIGDLFQLFQPSSNQDSDVETETQFTVILPDGTTVGSFGDGVDDIDIHETTPSSSNIGDADESSGAPSDTKESVNKRKRKSRSNSRVMEVLSGLSPEERRDVLRTSLDKETDPLIASHSNTVFEAKVNSGIIEYLKKLQKRRKHRELFKLIDEMFDDIDDEFLRFLSKKMGVSHNRYRFVESYRNWKSNNFLETRGRRKLPIETLQIIHDVWNENSIPSVDCRNGRESITIRRSLYLQRYHKDLSHPQPLLDKVKRNTHYFSATRRIVTCTNQKVVDIIKEKHNISLSVGTVWVHKPFYIVHPTEKEKQLCLCKTCYNKRQLFNALKKEYPVIGESLSGFLMGKCDCSKDENGFWKLRCCTGKCSNCAEKKSERIEMPGIDTETKKIRYHLFEETRTPYVSKKTQQQKISKKIERTPDKHDLPRDVLKALLDKADEYLLHRYQVSNDNFVWKQVLENTEDPVFHMDFSENLGPTPKEEVQPAHFAKRQFSLHCTVKLPTGGSKENTFIYHLSDDLSHDVVFTMAVVEDLIRRFAPNAKVIRFKSDNCSTQYKCKYIFQKWRELAKKLNKTFIIYYGASGHGKGLVDAMSGFGVKTPMRKAIITDNFFYNKSQLLHEWLLKQKFKSNREYIHFEPFQRTPKKQWEKLPIAGCQKQHIFVYFPDGSLQYKENMCCCDKCLAGNLISCKFEKGVEKFKCKDINYNSDEDLDGDDSSDSGSECSSNSSESEGDQEVYQIVGDAVLGAVEEGTTVAIYSPPHSNELFYLCQVLEKVDCAENDFMDENNKTRRIAKGSSYLKCRYLEKVNEKKSKIYYKSVAGFTYVLPYQVFLPCVQIEYDESEDRYTVDSWQYMDLISMI